MGRSLHYILIVFSFSIILVSNQVAGRGTDNLIEYFNLKALPVNDTGDLDDLVDRAGTRRLVLLGEASHGTSEFYEWRTEITKRLITEKGSNFIAVEGDWASIYRLNKYVMGMPGANSSARSVLLDFDRWPEWMWGNTVIEELAEWLKEHNSTVPEERKVGFYGMDVYGQWQAMDDLLEYTREFLPDNHRIIKRNLTCFSGYDRDEWAYARAVTGRGHASCEEELKNVVEILDDHSDELMARDKRKYFRARQNAFVIKNAEDFFRLAITDNTASWNSRATHMWETVRGLMQRTGPDSRGIVWAHNTHVGDADATVMRFQSMVNIGKLSREYLGPAQVFITGFGTYTGKVNAGNSWGSRMERMSIPEGIEDSYEYIFGHLDHEQFLLIFDDEDRNHPALNEFRGHRAIGVVYNPRREAGNYVPTILPLRYDSFLFIRETTPLQPVR